MKTQIDSSFIRNIITIITTFFEVTEEVYIAKIKQVERNRGTIKQQRDDEQKNREKCFQGSSR
jgi:hypothetical protein